jgi:hypothetical protein
MGVGIRRFPRQGPESTRSAIRSGGADAVGSISRPTVYRSLERTTTLPPLPSDGRPLPDVAKYDQLLSRTPEAEIREGGENGD